MKKLLFLVVMSVSAMGFAEESSDKDKRFYGDVKVGFVKPENTGANFDPGVSLGVNAGMIWDQSWSLGVNANYIRTNSKDSGVGKLTLIPVLADLTYAFNNEGSAHWYIGVLSGATASKLDGTDDTWNFTLGAKTGARFDLTPELTIAPEIYGNNVFVAGEDYQIWGAQLLLGMRF